MPQCFCLLAIAGGEGPDPAVHQIRHSCLSPPPLCQPDHPGDSCEGLGRLQTGGKWLSRPSFPGLLSSRQDVPSPRLLCVLAGAPPGVSAEPPH